MKNIHIISTEKPRQYRGGKVSTFTAVASMMPTEFIPNMHITNDEYIGLSYYLDGNLIRKGVVDDRDYWEVRKDYKKIILTTDQDLIKDGVQAISGEFLQWFVKNPSCVEVEVEKEKSIGYAGDRQRTFYGKYKIIIPKEEPKQENKVLVEMQQIPKRDSEFMGHYESCDLCHYNAFFKYLYNGEILYRCQGHKIVDINNLKSKFGFGNEEPKQETLEEALNKFVRTMLLDQSVYIDFLQCAEFGAKWQQEQDKKLWSEEEVLDLLEKRTNYVVNPTSFFTGVKQWFEQFKKK